MKKVMPEQMTNVEGVAKRRVFNLDKFEKETVEVKYVIPQPLTSIEEVQKLPAENVLKLVNAGLKRSAMLEAKASINGASPKIVNQMVNAFRVLPNYSKILVNGPDGSPTAESRKQQTQAIYAWLKTQPEIVEGLKQAAAAAVDEDDDENDAE